MRRWSEVAERVSATTRTSVKTHLLADYLRTLDANQLPVAAVFFAGRPFAEVDGRTTGLGWAAISGAVASIADVRPDALGDAYDRTSDLGLAVADVLEQAAEARRAAAVPDPAEPVVDPPTLADVSDAYAEIETASGSQAKAERFSELLRRCDPSTACYVVKILTGELRIGLGEGLLDPLASSAFATVKFALERALGVDSHTKTDVQGTRLSKIDNGNLWLEHDVVLKTTYQIQNGSELAVKLLIKHPRRSGARLYQPPKGTEDTVGTGSALVPTELPAHGKQELVVDERSAEPEYADWFGIAADKAVKAYLADPRADAKVAQQLTALWPLRGQIVAKQEQRNKLSNELGQLQSEAYQKRADLRAIEKNKSADALRRSLTARIGVISSREEVLTAQNIQLGQDLSDLQTRWREGVAAMHLVEAPPPK